MMEVSRLEVEVVASDADLADLATRATAEFRLARDYAISAVEHAVTCGELLLLVKRSVPTGMWRRWCIDNVPEISKSSVGRFTRLATYKEELSQAGEFKTITHACDFLQGLRPMSNPNSRRNIRAARIGAGRVRHQSHRFDLGRATEMRAQGSTFRAIATEVGVSESAIRSALDDGQYARGLERNRALYTPRTRLTAEERARSVHRVGVAAIEAAAIVSRCALVIERAINEARNAHTRRTLCEALHHAQSAEAKINETIRGAA